MLAMALALSLVGSDGEGGVERNAWRSSQSSFRVTPPEQVHEAVRIGQREPIGVGGQVSLPDPSLSEPTSVQTLPEEIELQSGDEWGRRDWEHEA